MLLASLLSLLALGPVVHSGQQVQVNLFETFGIIANNAFFYYADVERAAAFYRDTLGLPVVADYGFAKVLRVARSSYLTLVDASRGMHAADEPKTVAIALVTDDLDGWYTHVRARGVPLRGPYQPREGRPHDGFVAVDPEGYFLEFERFNPHQENAHLTPVLAAVPELAASPAGEAGSGGALPRVRRVRPGGLLPRVRRLPPAPAQHAAARCVGSLTLGSVRLQADYPSDR